MPDFQTGRAQNYRIWLISEAIIGRTDGSIDPVRLAEISQRLLDARRLSADDELLGRLAGAITLVPLSERKTISQKIRSWLGK
jgi:hypothetical protein